MILFTIPKPFKEDIGIIQKNAIRSWLSVADKVILFGNEEGVSEAAKELGVVHFPGIKTNEFQTPLMDSVFREAKKIASDSVYAYVNADIILTEKVTEALSKVKQKDFLIVARRRDVNVKDLIDFSDPHWQEKIEKGALHGFSGIDCFIFPSHLFSEIPAFAVGRYLWDNWFIFNARKKKIPVIDATETIDLIHQNHNYSIQKEDHFEIERQRNIKLAGGLQNAATIVNSDWLLVPSGLMHPPFKRRVWAEISLFYPVRVVLGMRRRVRARKKLC